MRSFKKQMSIVSILLIALCIRPKYIQAQAPVKPSSGHVAVPKDAKPVTQRSDVKAPTTPVRQVTPIRKKVPAANITRQTSTQRPITNTNRPEQAPAKQTASPGTLPQSPQKPLTLPANIEPTQGPK
jgi:hypothetical protein